MTTQACKDFQISYMQEMRWVVWWNFELTLELSLNLEKEPNRGWLFCDLIAVVEIKLIKLSWAGAGQPIEKWNQAERPGNIFLLVIQLISRPSLYCYHLSYNVQHTSIEIFKHKVWWEDNKNWKVRYKAGNKIQNLFLNF